MMLAKNTKVLQDILHRTGLDKRTVVSIKEFKAGDDFSALYTAKNFLETERFAIGSMCGNEPIGFAPASQYKYIAKWRNIDPKDRELVFGVILSENFRTEDVYVVLFKESI